MSRRLLIALGGTTVVALAAALLNVVPAQADGEDHFNSSATVDVPPGGTATVTSPSMDTSIKKAKVEWTAPALSDEDPEGFKDMALTLLQQPTPGKRIMTCVTLATRAHSSAQVALAAGGTLDQIEEYEAVAETLLLVRLLTCVRLAQLVSEALAGQRVQVPRLAGSKCGQAPVGMKEKIVRKGGKFHLTVKALKVSKKYQRVRVNCKLVSPTKVSTTIVPKKNASNLRKALAGPNLGTGMASPSSAEKGAKVKTSFKAP